MDGFILDSSVVKMTDTHIVIILFIGFFILAGCASVAPSTYSIKAPIPKSDFGDYDSLTSPLALPYIDNLTQSSQSGAMLISDGSYALMHRASLAKMAKYSIEIQTYIYKNDITSRVLMHEIWQAANRGVKIKILIDDNGLDSDYSDVIALNNHPNIEVRVFNPYRNRIRFFRLPEMIFDFNRINRRMHNKLFIVDGIALIIGGRNIADSYFDNTLEVNFSDTDAFFLGNIAKEAQNNFIEYWEYHRAIPVEFLPSKHKMKKFLKNYPKIISKLESNENELDKYHQAMDNFIDKYRTKQNVMYWGEARLVADSPFKIDAKNPTSKIYGALKEAQKQVTDSIYIASAYLVPGKRGLADIKDSIQKGVNVFILTNSLSSTDVLVSYGAWERYRDRLIKANANVYEYRKSEGRIRIKGRLSSGSSLHSKVLVFDNKITWVGSFNLDPRSGVLDTEVMAVFDNKEFAKETAKLMRIEMDKSWRLKMSRGKTIWCAMDNDNSLKQQICYTHSPDTSVWMRLLNVFAKIVPENLI